MTKILPSIEQLVSAQLSAIDKFLERTEALKGRFHAFNVVVTFDPHGRNPSDEHAKYDEKKSFLI
jgi:hypothetical protein